MAIAGWIVWTLACLYALLLLIWSVTPPAKEAKGTPIERLSAVVFVCVLAGLIAAIALDISKLHLLWYAPLATMAIFVGSLLLNMPKRKTQRQDVKSLFQDGSPRSCRIFTSLSSTEVSLDWIERVLLINLGTILESKDLKDVKHRLEEMMTEGFRFQVIADCPEGEITTGKLDRQGDILGGPDPDDSQCVPVVMRDPRGTAGLIRFCYYFPASGKGRELRTDGLYRSGLYYLRFYEDGTVLSVSSTGTPDQVARWFAKENLDKMSISHGRYDICGSDLAFSSKSSRGTVDYEGAIEGTTLTLRSHSHINGHRGSRKYCFVACWQRDPEKKETGGSRLDVSTSPAAAFDPVAHFREKDAKDDFRMNLENYRDLADALKRIPSLEIDDPRLPPPVKKEPKPFRKMLESVEFVLGQSAIQGGRIRVEVHHGLFAYATDGRFEYEIAKLGDDAFLVWEFGHDPNEKVKPLFTDRPCAFRLAGEPDYRCCEKAVTVSSGGLCLFHMNEGPPAKMAASMGNLLWLTFKSAYRARLEERLRAENYDCRGFCFSSSLGDCVNGHVFKALADFREATFDGLWLRGAVWESGARFDNAVFRGNARFVEAAFHGPVSFAGARFSGSAGFMKTVFTGPVDFRNADFTPEEVRAYDQVVPSLTLDGADFKGGLNFEGATGLRYVQTADEKLRGLMNAQGTAEPSTPPDRQMPMWKQQLAEVTRQLLSDPSDDSLETQKADLERAIYGQLLRQGHDPAECHLRLGCASMAYGDWDRAREHFHECLNLDNDNPAASLGLARCDLFRNVASEETERLLLAAVRKEPDLVNACGWPGNDVNLWLGLQFRLSGNASRAVAYLRREVEVNPKGLWANQWLGEACLAAADIENAMAAFEREIQAFPRRFWPHLYLEAIHAALGDSNEAERHRQEATFNNPGKVVLGGNAVRKIHEQVRRSRGGQRGTPNPVAAGSPRMGVGPLEGIGVLFDIDALGGGFYGARAWELFMQRVDPLRLSPCVLREGDTRATLEGRARQFCIAVYGSERSVRYVREVFGQVELRGLVSEAERLADKRSLVSEPLSLRGILDTSGRLVEDAWTRVSHDLCKHSGWGYAPANVPADLDAQLAKELEALRLPRGPRTSSPPRQIVTGASSTKESVPKADGDKANIFELLMDTVCCVMCADRRVGTAEREAIYEIVRKTGAFWGRSEVNEFIKRFVKRVERKGLDRVVEETCDRLPDVRKRGKGEAFVRCVDYMVDADGTRDESERRLRERFSAILADDPGKASTESGEEEGRRSERGSPRTEPVARGSLASKLMLADAVERGDVQEVARLLDAGPEIANLTDEHGYTLLHQAARDGRREIADLLLANGADVSRQTREGWTALHLATALGHGEVVELLLSHGADVNAVDELGLTPLCQAAADGLSGIIEALLAAGANVNVGDRAQQTPLRHAAMGGHDQAAEILRRHGGR